MIQASPIDSLAPIHYRHTSYLRGFDESEKHPHQAGSTIIKDAPPFHPFNTLPFKRFSSLSVELPNEGKPLNEPRTLPPSHGPLFDEEKEAKQQNGTAAQTDLEGADAKSRSTSMAAAMIPGEAIREERRQESSTMDSQTAPRKALDKLNRPLASPRSESYRSPPQDAKRPFADDDEDPDKSESKLTGSGAGGGRLPGIAHLDRQMQMPWNSSSRHPVVGSEEEASRWAHAGKRREEDDEAATWSASKRARQGTMDTYSDGPSPHLSSRPSLEPYTRRSFAHGGGYPGERFSSVKRSGSPSDREREYDSAPQTGALPQHNRYPLEGRLSEAESVTWPSSPALRTSSGSPLMDSVEGRRWRSSTNGHLPPPSLSSKRSSAPFGTIAHEYGPERSSLPPLTMRGPQHGARYDAPLYPRSPPLRSSFDGRSRLHGGSGSSTSSLSEHHHYSYGHRAPPSVAPAGLPHSSSAGGPSLRSLSTPYPYDGASARGDDGRRYYDDADQYDDHQGRHEALGVSSPRHHPYAGSNAAGGAHGGGHGHMHGGVRHPSPSSYVDAAPSAANAGAGSPTSMPRRRGKLPKPVTDLLKTWLLDHAAHPYPTEDEKRRLCAATGLSISQVSNWFINARRRILVPQGSGHFGVAPSSMNAPSPSMGSSKPPPGGSRHSPGPQMHHHQGPSPPSYYGHQGYQADSPRAAHRVHHPHHPQHHHPGHHPSMSSSRQHSAASGLPPLGPPPLPSHHYGGGGQGSGAEQGHGMHYRMTESYPRSAEQSPLLSRRRDSP